MTGPTYSSVGLESGRNIMRACADHTTDLAIVRNIKVGGARQLQFRLDMFNAFNVTVINARQNQIQYNSPTNLTIRNPQFVAAAGNTTLAPGADGTVLNSARLAPKDAGFGAATGAQNMRNLQLQIRFQF